MLKYLVVALWAMVCVSGCATMEGLGKDLGKLGDKIEDAAKK
ncbi:MAG: entericidin A/B family lipoprotein [Pseudomonadota bacterium]